VWILCKERKVLNHPQASINSNIFRGFMLPDPIKQGRGIEEESEGKWRDKKRAERKGWEKKRGAREEGEDG
jgi:hypothetical protein